MLESRTCGNACQASLLQPVGAVILDTRVSLSDVSTNLGHGFYYRMRALSAQAACAFLRCHVWLASAENLG